MLAYVNTKCGKDAADSQPDAEVPHATARLVFNNGKDQVPNTANSCRHHNDKAAYAVSIANQGGQHTTQKADKVDRCGQALSIDTGVPEPLQYRRQEVRKSCEGVVAHEVNHHMHEVTVVGRSRKELAPVDAAFGCGVAGLHAFEGEGLFVFGEASGCAGAIGEEEVDDGSEEDGGRAFDEEEKAPGLDGVLDLRNAVGHCAGEAVGEGGHAEEDGGAEGEFAALVEEGEVVWAVFLMLVCEDSDGVERPGLWCEETRESGIRRTLQRRNWLRRFRGRLGRR